MRLVGFDEGKRRLAEALVERSLNGRDRITCRQLLQESLPQFLKDNILQLAQNQFKLEKPFSWNLNANFDVDDGEVRSSLERLIFALVKSIRLNRQEVEKCIHDSIHLRLDILLRPQTALEEAYFTQYEQIDRKTLLRQLEKIGKDVPIIGCLIDKIEKYDKNNISRIDFSMITKDIKSNIYNAQQQNEAIKEFDLLMDLFGLDQTLRPKGLETILVEDFFVARGLQSALSYVRKKSMQGKQYWLRQDVNDILDYIINQNGGTKSAVLPKIEKEELALPRIIYSDDNFEPIYRVNIERQPPGPYPSILSLIDRKSWKQILRKLFSKDEEEFRSFINKVDYVDQWREAKQIIDWELNKRKVDPYCKEAVKLGDIVFSKFFSNGKMM